MKQVFTFCSIAFLLTGLVSCTKTESNFTNAVPETITLKSNTLNTPTGVEVEFQVISSINDADVTGLSRIYINGSEINGNTYTFQQAGTYSAYAQKGTLQSNSINLQATAIAPNTTAFVHRVLVEEYSGTWCGNCPRILYGVDLLQQQTNKAIVVSTHLFNGDPFITSDGNNLANNQGIGGVPSGNINRTTNWDGPQYQNVDQVVAAIQPSSKTGLAISSTVNGSNLNATIRVNHAQALTGATTITVYLVEDKLYFTQRNYSSNLYGGQGNIPNFEYNGVLRAVLSNLNGDPIASSGNNIEKVYTLPLPSNISNRLNVKLVAFVADATGKVVNVQEAKLGDTKDFEML